VTGFCRDVARAPTDARAGQPIVATRRWIAGRASAVLALVLVAMSGFGVLSTFATRTAGDRALAAIGIANDYSNAAAALAAERSLEQTYRLEPGPEVLARFHVAAGPVAASLADVQAHGNASDRALAETLRADHVAYVDAVDRLFAAVDRGDTSAVLEIDDTEATPAFDSMSATVSQVVADKRRLALDQLKQLQRLEDLTRWLSPAVLVFGLVFAARLLWIIKEHRRMLDAQAARAVHDSLHDGLTGLPNRTLLAQRLEQALAAEAETETALLLIDLDRFKEVNDTYGHDYGDLVLGQFGQRLRDAVPRRATVARLGGDEFAVILPDTGSLAAVTAEARNVLAALEGPFHVDDVALDVEASIGVVMSGVHGKDGTTLLKRADIAMYVAKAEQVGVSVYDPTRDNHSPEQLALLGDLRRALDNGEFVLTYEPQMRIGDGAVVAAEALVRWQHPEHGLIHPHDFIPLAEHTGLIVPLTSFVLDSALAQARTWSDAGRRLTIAVNLSARNLLDPQLAGRVAALLDAHGVDPALLELEVTETAIMTEPLRARRVLRELSALGITIALDDFGAGYTSLRQLTALPIAKLKIDLSLVSPMTGDPDAALIVGSVVELGHRLGLLIVAEGVEDAKILDALELLGCDIAQGYHVSRSLTVDAFDAWAAGRHLDPAPPVNRAPRRSRDRQL
jgi:diguanylate cyclase (GGDEF)-like protein